MYKPSNQHTAVLEIMYVPYVARMLPVLVPEQREQEKVSHDDQSMSIQNVERWCRCEHPRDLAALHAWFSSPSSSLRHVHL